MKALDLFCGAGGATKGLQLAGFHVTGIDLKPQPNYPGDIFHQGDAIEALHQVTPEEFDLIWASPPCQAFTAYRRRKGHVGEHPNLIPTARALLRSSTIPYVIENVPGAPLENPVQLCGSSFGLDVRRHRLFEASFQIPKLECRHHEQTPRFPPASNRTNLRSTVEIGVWRIPLTTQQKAMGINWMSREELSQAIPPAYAKHIGHAAIRSTP